MVWKYHQNNYSNIHIKFYIYFAIKEITGLSHNIIINNNNLNKCKI